MLCRLMTPRGERLSTKAGDIGEAPKPNAGFAPNKAQVMCSVVNTSAQMGLSVNMRKHSSVTARFGAAQTTQTANRLFVKNLRTP
mmetsp:Transcript_8945/g.33169  ORF Transcript_8945/g.33169 Transcript_8945/m.33169 type:complete len:85 (+) Transcript_8945:587-841(+)